jgi:NADPH:quinone reductase-like Zn-dependent oxidoreductase
MTAAKVHQFGDPNAIVLEQIPVPTPGPSEVLVEVKAAGVGPWDAWIRAGNSVLPQPLPLTLGSDLSGVVAGIGPDVTAFALGEPVFGVTNPRFTGAYAEYALAAGGMIALKPPSLTDAQAASVPVIAVTAWQALFPRRTFRTARGCSSGMNTSMPWRTFDLPSVSAPEEVEDLPPEPQPHDLPAQLGQAR